MCFMYMSDRVQWHSTFTKPFNRRSREDTISRTTWYENVTKPDIAREQTATIKTLRRTHPKFSNLDIVEHIANMPKRSFYPYGP